MKLKSMVLCALCLLPLLASAQEDGAAPQKIPATEIGQNGAPQNPPPLAQEGASAAGREGRNETSAVPIAQEGCLKEGEPCNPLNDRCCPGCYCFGGLVPTCFRKP